MPRNEHLPLVILNRDSQGKTALDWAVENQKPQSFSLMVSMLEKSDHLCISKLMLASFPNMIKNDSEFVLNYFNNSVFKPVLLQEALIVLWP